jgi:hypothetical protein
MTYAGDVYHEENLIAYNSSRREVIKTGLEGKNHSYRKGGTMKDKQENIMIYSFVCPLPCNREVKVAAKNILDAIDKIIIAGAMSCRNLKNKCICEKAHIDMPPIPEEQLKDIVSLCMREECAA